MQMTFDPDKLAQDMQKLFELRRAREAAFARERELIEQRDAVKKQLSEYEIDDTGVLAEEGESEEYHELTAQHWAALRGIDAARDLAKHLATQVDKGLAALEKGEEFKPSFKPEPKAEKPAEPAQMSLPINRGDAPVGEAIVHRPSLARNLDDQAEGAEIAARPIGDLAELVDGITMGEVMAIKRAAGGSLWNGKTIGSFLGWLRLGDMTRLPHFVKDTTLKTAEAIWNAAPLRPLLGPVPGFTGEPGASPAPLSPGVGRLMATPAELEKIVGERAAAILVDAGLISLDDVATYIAEHGGADALKKNVGVTATAVKELTRALTEREAEVPPTGKPRAKTVKPAAPVK